MWFVKKGNRNAQFMRQPFCHQQIWNMFPSFILVDARAGYELINTRQNAKLFLRNPFCFSRFPQTFGKRCFPGHPLSPI